MIKPDAFMLGPFELDDPITQAKDEAWNHMIVEAAAFGFALDYNSFRINFRAEKAHAKEVYTSVNPKIYLRALIL